MMHTVKIEQMKFFRKRLEKARQHMTREGEEWEKSGSWMMAFGFANPCLDRLHKSCPISAHHYCYPWFIGYTEYYTCGKT